MFKSVMILFYFVLLLFSAFLSLSFNFILATIYFNVSLLKNLTNVWNFSFTPIRNTFNSNLPLPNKIFFLYIRISYNSLILDILLNSKIIVIVLFCHSYICLNLFFHFINFKKLLLLLRTVTRMFIYRNKIKMIAKI